MASYGKLAVPGNGEDGGFRLLLTCERLLWRIAAYLNGNDEAHGCRGWWPQELGVNSKNRRVIVARPGAAPKAGAPPGRPLPGTTNTAKSRKSQRL